MLITKTKEILPYEKLNNSFNVEKIGAYIEAAELKYIKPMLSSDLHYDLTIAYQNSIRETNPVGLEIEYINLLHYVRRPLTQLALSLGSSSLAVNVTSNGINRTEVGSQKTAYGYQELNWKRDKMNLGMDFLDELGEYLESQVHELSFYEDSPERVQRLGMFVSTSQIMTDHVGIKVGRYIHTLLYPQFIRAERKVKRIIGAEEFANLKASLVNGDFTEQNETVEMIREAVSNLALAQAIPLLRLKVDGQGITMINNEKTKSVEVHKPVKDSQSLELLENLTATGEAALLELQEMYADEEGSVLTEPSSFTQPQGGFIT